MKETSFIFKAIIKFVFKTIAGFVFKTIISFIFEAINLLHNWDRKYSSQIKFKLKKIIIYLDEIYLHYIYFCKYLCCKN